MQFKKQKNVWKMFLEKDIWKSMVVISFINNLVCHLQILILLVKMHIKWEWNFDYVTGEDTYNEFEDLFLIL